MRWIASSVIRAHGRKFGDKLPFAAAAGGKESDTKPMSWVFPSTISGVALASVTYSLISHAPTTRPTALSPLSAWFTSSVGALFVFFSETQARICTYVNRPINYMHVFCSCLSCCDVMSFFFYTAGSGDEDVNCFFYEMLWFWAGEHRQMEFLTRRISFSLSASSFDVSSREMGNFRREGWTNGKSCENDKTLRWLRKIWLYLHILF